MKKKFIIISHEGNATHIILKFYLTPAKQTKHNKSWCRYREKGMLTHWCRDINPCNHYGNEDGGCSKK
jgi:hypothetical protein